MMTVAVQKAGHDLREMLDEIEALPIVHIDDMAFTIQNEIQAAKPSRTVEITFVRHGRWIYSDPLDYKDPNGVIHVHGMCSCCRLIYDFRDMTSRFKFCPNCGARMDGEEEQQG